MTTQMTSRQLLLRLHNEIDCRIEHGAESNGHLDYVIKELNEIISKMDDENGI